MKTAAWMITMPFLLITLSAGQSRWPAIKQQEFVFHFVEGKSETFSANILSVSGKSVYHVECASAHGSSQLETAGDVWSGDIECHLQPTEKQRIYNVSLLLSPKDPSVSSGRAVFLAYELKGQCANFPDWGLSREFRLRGMRLVLSLLNPVFQRYTDENHFTGFKAVDLAIRIYPDPLAMSTLALPAQYEPPKVLNPEESDYNKYRVDCTHVSPARP